MADVVEQVKKELEIIKIIQSTLGTNGITALEVYKVLRKSNLECAKECGRCCCCKENKCSSCQIKGNRNELN